MSKALIDEVRKSGGELATVPAARQAIDTVIAAIKTVAANGQKVTLQNFGTFERKHRAERQGRNPQTGEAIRIAARDTLTFKSSKSS